MALINSGSDICFDYEVVKYDKQNRIKAIKFTNIKRKNSTYGVVEDGTEEPVIVEVTEKGSDEKAGCC